MKAIISIFAAIALLSGCGYPQKQQLDFDIKKIAVGKSAASVEVADFNKDGNLDIAFANHKKIFYPSFWQWQRTI
ncbi:hypothetical protein [Parafilimonas sp.]|uniref:hypothetical protein n=1 Tax=Parafilimonas sp. TaxID=1969739 RepID=UPI0039E429AD